MSPNKPNKAAKDLYFIDESKLEVTLHDNPPAPLRVAQPGLKVFTPHMLRIDWHIETGWSAPLIEVRQKLALDPAASVLHYGTSCFEGMKAYKGKDGKARLFRPKDNMNRFNRSAERLCLPTFDADTLVRLISKLVAYEADWIPAEYGTSLYIRPTMVGTGDSLGIHRATGATLFVICAPMFSYFAKKPAPNPDMTPLQHEDPDPEWPAQPIGLHASMSAVRAWRGGVGNYKLGGNYGPTLLHINNVAKHGYAHNLWLFEDGEVTECGGMNLFVMFRRGETYELATPSLDSGLILPGITRMTILDLARKHASAPRESDLDLPDKLIVSERTILLAEIVEASRNGTLVEMFGSGTAVVIQPIDRLGVAADCGLSDSDFDIQVPCELVKGGRASRALFHGVYGRQNGSIPSEWSRIVN